MKSKKEKTRQKTIETKRFKRLALYGLILAILFIFIGMFTQPAIVIIGYTLLVMCTGIFSFLTVLNWLSTKSLEREQRIKSVPKPSHRTCPRCGTKMKRNIEFCRKCGKKL